MEESTNNVPHPVWRTSTHYIPHPLAISLPCCPFLSYSDGAGRGQESRMKKIFGSSSIGVWRTSSPDGLDASIVLCLHGHGLLSTALYSRRAISPIPRCRRGLLGNQMSTFCSLLTPLCSGIYGPCISCRLQTALQQDLQNLR